MCSGRISSALILSETGTNERRRRWQPLALGGLALLTVLAYYYLRRSESEGAYGTYQLAVFWALAVLLILWLGNYLMYRLIEWWYGRRVFTTPRLVLQLVVTLVFSLAAINLSYYFFKIHYTELPPIRQQVELLNLYGLVVLIPLVSIQFAIFYLAKWRQAVTERQQAERERLRGELLGLRAQLSPHFLFNNLNMIASLVEPGNRAAQDFIDRFAAIYRYVLRHREADLVTLAEELAFVDDYVYLLRIRFGDALRVERKTEGASGHWKLPPLSLQILLENVLKHNALDRSSPLLIRITAGADRKLSVRNELRPRSGGAIPSEGAGLDNIRRRYWLLTRGEPTVLRQEDFFTVVLPLI